MLFVISVSYIYIRIYIFIYRYVSCELNGDSEEIADTILDPCQRGEGVGGGGIGYIQKSFPGGQCRERSDTAAIQVSVRQRCGSG